jgi:hypothetical protein
MYFIVMFTYYFCHVCSVPYIPLSRAKWHSSEQTAIRFLTASLHFNVATDFRFGSLSIRSNPSLIGVLRPDWKWADLSENGVATDETPTSDLRVGVKHITSPRLFLSFCPSVYLSLCMLFCQHTRR